MTEPQITHSFSSKEEEDKFYVQSGYQKAVKDMMGVVAEMEEYNITVGNDEYSLGTMHGWDSAMLELKTKLKAMEVQADDKG